jgi:hypothetical protein
MPAMHMASSDDRGPVAAGMRAALHRRRLMQALGGALVILGAAALLTAELTVFHWVDRFTGSSGTTHGPAVVSPDGRWEARLVVDDPGAMGSVSSQVEARPLRDGRWAAWCSLDQFETQGHVSWQNPSTVLFTTMYGPVRRHAINVSHRYYPSVIGTLKNWAWSAVVLVLVTALLFWPVTLLLAAGLLAVWLVPRSYDRNRVKPVVVDALQCLRTRDWHGAADCFWVADEHAPGAGETTESRLETSELARACATAAGAAPRLRRLRRDRKLPGLGYAADVSFPGGAAGGATPCTVSVMAVGKEWRLLLE